MKKDEEKSILLKFLCPYPKSYQQAVLVNKKNLSGVSYG